MELEQLRPALHGVAAYKHLTDEPMMGLVLSLLDKLSAGDGTGALEDYTRLFYELRAAGCGGPGRVAARPAALSGVPLCPDGGAGEGGQCPRRGGPAGC